MKQVLHIGSGTPETGKRQQPLVTFWADTRMPMET